MRRLLAIGLLAAIAVLTALPALAQEDDTTTTTEGEVTAVPISSQVGDPAVEVDLNPAVEATPPAWTYRFLIPLLVLLTVVVVAVTVIQYFNQVVKARYKPVE